MTEPQEKGKKTIGHFFAFDGIDGCGKTTQARRLATALSEQGYDVLLVQDPGTTEFGRRIREMLLDSRFPLQPETQAMLFAAVRRETSEKILQHVMAGGIAITDRWALSTIVYQGVVQGVALGFVHELTCSHSACPIRPDCYFLLDVPAEIAVQRRDLGDDRFESAGLAAAQQRREAFRDKAEDIIWTVSARPVQIIDGDQAEELVTAAIWKHLPEELQTALAAAT